MQATINTQQPLAVGNSGRAAHPFTQTPPRTQKEEPLMAHMHIYSKTPCVRCDGVLRSINSAITKGDLDPERVTVHMMDGSEPRAGKVHEAVTVARVMDPDDQAALSKMFAAHPSIGMSAPVVIVKDDDDSELDAFNDFNPNKVKEAIELVGASPALVASA